MLELDEPLMRRFSSLLIPSIVLLALAAACGSSDASTPESTPDGGGVTVDGATPPSTSPEGGADASKPCVEGAPERQTDAHACGKCGHDCEGGACSAGQCKAYTLTTTTDKEGIFTGLTVVGDQVYFATNQQLGGTIQSYSMTTHAKTTLDPTYFNAGAVVSDGTTLFIGGQAGVYQRAIGAGAGVATTKLVDTTGNVSGLALDGATLYLANGASVQKVTKTGGTVADVFTASGGIVALAVAANLVYATDYGSFAVAVYDTTGAAATRAINADMAFPEGIAVVGSEIWYGRLDLDGAGGIFARPSDGTGTKHAIVPMVNGRSVFVTDAALYFTTDHELMKLVR
jgi:glutamine cyclotransferase